MAGKHLGIVILALAALLLGSGRAIAQDRPSLSLEGDFDAAVKTNILNLVDISRYACQPPAVQYNLLRRQIRDNAFRALQAMGYYHPSLTLTLNTATDNHCIAAHLQGHQGPVVVLEKVDLQLHGDARDDSAFQALLADSPLHRGDQLRHDRYNNLKKQLQQLLINRGYIQGRLTTHQLSVDTKRNRAAVILHVDSGPRYRFGKVTLQGSTLKPALLRPYLRFHPGEPFNNSLLLETQQAYLGAGYFSAVRIQRGSPKDGSQQIPISIHFSDRNRWSLLAGVGASTDTGPRLRLGVENRQVNRAGHRFHAETELSGVQQGAGAGYQIPLRDPLHERLDLHTSYVNESTDSNDNERISTGADYIVELENKWVATTSLELLRETYDVAGQLDRADLLIPGFQLSRVKTSDPIYPRRGWRLNGKIRFADQALSSTASFLQATLSGKLILPLLGGRILSRVDLGYTEVSNVNELPASLRFFAGGDASVRGFGYESLGPEDNQGNVIGGRHLATASLEYDHPISRQWSVAAFTDAGNAFNVLNNFRPRHSAGAGVRWRSPLGPIRIDLARALDQSRSWRIHLSMGPDL
ncbi:MAG: autotransporter assembly complex family protein [Alcanivorax sp.]|nr:autotransporter assembly complex family protein [Alcanivorax sp.]